ARVNLGMPIHMFFLQQSGQDELVRRATLDIRDHSDSATGSPTIKIEQTFNFGPGVGAASGLDNGSGDCPEIVLPEALALAPAATATPATPRPPPGLNGAGSGSGPGAGNYSDCNGGALPQSPPAHNNGSGGTGGNPPPGALGPPEW